jgi:hypothetical protein
MGIKRRAPNTSCFKVKLLKTCFDATGQKLRAHFLCFQVHVFPSALRSMGRSKAQAATVRVAP